MAAPGFSHLSRHAPCTFCRISILHACMRACACILFPYTRICLCTWCLIILLERRQPSCLHASCSCLPCICMGQPTKPDSIICLKVHVLQQHSREILLGLDQHTILVNQILSLLVSFWLLQKPVPADGLPDHTLHLFGLPRHAYTRCTCSIVASFSSLYQAYQRKQSLPACRVLWCQNISPM